MTKMRSTPLPVNKFLARQWVHLTAAVVLGMSVALTYLFLRQPIRMAPKAQAANAVQYTLMADDEVLTGPTTVRLFLDPNRHALAFVRTEMRFDPAQIQLNGEIATSGLFRTVVKKTSAAAANQTGQIVMVLGLAPGDIGAAPALPFEVAEFSVRPATSAPISATISQPTAGQQVVDVGLNDLTELLHSVALILNPTPIPTATPTRVPSGTPVPTAIPSHTPVPPTATPGPTLVPAGGSNVVLPTSRPTAGPTFVALSPAGFDTSPTVTPLPEASPSPVPSPTDVPEQGGEQGKDRLLFYIALSGLLLPLLVWLAYRVLESRSDRKSDR